jgi:cyclopropane fatty-acyl-phospholipid synthase-like methyltransferase
VASCFLVLEQAERLAGVQRTRIWRLYLRAARHGFDTSITAVYQVRARRPTPLSLG